MGRKIAFVDIDSCLLIGGKLNPNLVEKLRTGGYDEIVLFTQRSMYMQSGQIPRTIQQAALEKELDEPNALDLDTHLHTTPQVIEALENALERTVKLSTSVDTYVGNQQSFGYKGTLMAYERELAAKHKAYCEQYSAGDSSEEAQRALATINAEMHEKLKVEQEAVKAGRQQEVDESLADALPNSYYPTDKVVQYEACTSALALGDEDTVDYFDDRLENIVEVCQKVKQAPSGFGIRKVGTLVPLTASLTPISARDKLIGADNPGQTTLAHQDLTLFESMLDNFEERAAKKSEYDFKLPLAPFFARARDKLKHGAKVRSRTSDLQLTYKIILLMRGEPIRPFTLDEHKSMMVLYPDIKDRLLSLNQNLDELLTMPRKNEPLPDKSYTSYSGRLESTQLTKTQVLLADVRFYRQCKQIDVQILDGEKASPKHLAKICVALGLENYLTELDRFERGQSETQPTLAVEPSQAKYAGGRIKELLSEVKSLDNSTWTLIDDEPEPTGPQDGLK